jgi:hypothetical protein
VWVVFRQRLCQGERARSDIPSLEGKQLTMATASIFSAGGYRYIPGVFQYSGGVAAEPGFEIERAVLRSPLPLAEGFRRIEAYLRSIGRPLTAFCACELRSPAQFSEAGFTAFNQRYCETLTNWDIYDPAKGINPVARSNVCPEFNPPAEPSFYAFSFTVPAASKSATFVVSGSGEVPEGKGSYGKFIVRRGETSADAMAEKVGSVLDEMERRLELLGFSWRRATATQIYTIRDIFPFLASDIVARGAANNGVCWHLARPPIVDLEFEMDCRSVTLERVL